VTREEEEKFTVSEHSRRSCVECPVTENDPGARAKSALARSRKPITTCSADERQYSADDELAGTVQPVTSAVDHRGERGAPIGAKKDAAHESEKDAIANGAPEQTGR